MEVNATGRGIQYDLQNHLLFRRVCTTPFRSSLAARGTVTGFSPSSGARMRRYLRTCTSEYTVLCTLTYPSEFPVSGSVCKRHLREFLRRVRRLYGTDTFSAFWFFEFQERGAPHFHLFLTCAVPSQVVAGLWYEIVGSDDERHLRAGTRIESLKSGRYGTCSYASKYAAKQCQKVVPSGFSDVGRFWGIVGVRSCHQVSVFIRPEYVDHPLHQRLRKELREAVSSQGKSGFKPVDRSHGYCVAVFLRKREVVSRVMAVLHRLGTLIECEGIGWISYPTREEELDGFFDARL